MYMYLSTPRIPNRTRFEQIKLIKKNMYFYIYIYIYIYIASILDNESILTVHNFFF